MPLYVPQFRPGTHDCYFEYLDANTCRLSRWGGDKLMINGKLETIPQGGVLLAPYDNQINHDALFVIAYMSFGTMVMWYYNDALVTDAYGMTVPQSAPQYTIVGMVLGRSTTFNQTGAVCGAISYYNRRQRAVSVNTSQGTNSAGAVWLNAFYCQTLCFAGDMIRFMGSGYSYTDIAGGRSYLDLRVKSPGSEPGADYGHHTYSANGNWPFGIGPHKDYIAPVPNWYGVSCWGYAPSGGTAFFAMNTGISFEG